jgi:hypothetical protein
MQVHHDKNFMLSGFAKFRPEIYNEQTHVGARTTDSCCYENVLNDKAGRFLQARNLKDTGEMNDKPFIP